MRLSKTQPAGAPGSKPAGVSKIRRASGESFRANAANFSTASAVSGFCQSAHGGSQKIKSASGKSGGSGRALSKSADKKRTAGTLAPRDSRDFFSEAKFFFCATDAAGFLSAKIAETAPRESASHEYAPVPAKQSSTVAPSTSAPSEEKTASRR